MDYIDYIRSQRRFPYRDLDDMYRTMHREAQGQFGTAWIDLLKRAGLYRELCGEIKHQFITIALPLDYDLKKIKKYIEKPHGWLIGAILSVERYSKVGENLHIHILKLGYYSKTKIIRDLSKKFKVSSNFIDVRVSAETTDYQHRENYIKGEKVDEHKMECVELDRAWREKHKIKHYYELH